MDIQECLPASIFRDSSGWFACRMWCPRQRICPKILGVEIVRQWQIEMRQFGPMIPWLGPPQISSIPECHCGDVGARSAAHIVLGLQIPLSRAIPHGMVVVRHHKINESLLLHAAYWDLFPTTTTLRLIATSSSTKRVRFRETSRNLRLCPKPARSLGLSPRVLHHITGFPLGGSSVAGWLRAGTH